MNNEIKMEVIDIDEILLKIAESIEILSEKEEEIYLFLSADYDFQTLKEREKIVKSQLQQLVSIAESLNTIARISEVMSSVEQI